MSSVQIVLWIYIALLLVGGFIGYARAKSKISIIASCVSAAILALFALGKLPIENAWIVLLVLLLMFIMRFLKTKKFMPAGLMLTVTAAALVLQFVLK